MSSECKDLIIKLLIKNPKQRLGSKNSQEIQFHPWFKDINFEEIF